MIEYTYGLSDLEYRVIECYILGNATDYQLACELMHSALLLIPYARADVIETARVCGQVIKRKFSTDPLNFIIGALLTDAKQSALLSSLYNSVEGNNERKPVKPAIAPRITYDWKKISAKRVDKLSAI